jgi:hypothetical protein
MEKVVHEPAEAAGTDGPESEGEKTASIASSAHRVGFSSSCPQLLTARLTQPRAGEGRSALGFLSLPPPQRSGSRAPPTHQCRSRVTDPGASRLFLRSSRRPPWRGTTGVSSPLTPCRSRSTPPPPPLTLLGRAS